MAIQKSPVAAFMDGKTAVVAQLVPCAINTLIGYVLGILGGLHGLVLVLDRVKKGEKVGPTDVLNVMFDDLVNRILFFIPPLAVALVVGGGMMGLSFILPASLAMVFMILTSLAMLAVMLVLSAIAPYALISVARDKTPWLEAWKRAVAKVQSDVGGNGVFMLVTGILGSLGVIGCFIGVYVTAPMGLIAQIQGYEEAGGLSA